MKAKFRLPRGSREDATCREVMRVLQSYLDGQTDEVTAQRVARHLEKCRRCGLEASVYLEIKISLARRALPVEAVTAARLRAFGERLAAGERPDVP
ncbi:MAG: hypothetical protein NVSMB12_00860 [Acidimicrobiales bacterium]